MHKYKGTLICVEGIDGSGKGTLIDKLQQYYSDSEEVIFTREPSDGFYGKAIRDRLKNDNEPTPADFFLFLADRYDHCENVIRPALKEGKTVITDRYALSTYAYQSKVLDEDLGLTHPFDYIDDMTYHFTIEPDLYLYLGIGVEEALRRSDAEEKYENRERLEEAKRVYDYFNREKENMVRIPASWSEEAVLEEASIHIDKHRL